MKSTGIVRKVAELGRIVLPIELRRTLNIEEKDALEIYVDENTIINAILKSGATVLSDNLSGVKFDNEITKNLFYTLGLTGRDNSKELRTKLLKSLNLPTYLTTNAMIDALNCLLTADELFEKVENLK